MVWNYCDITLKGDNHMKKIVALLLALLFCLGSFPAFAAVDLSAYTQEELLALRDSINKELLKRGIEKEVIVPIGIYIVGEDIPAGVYTIKTINDGAELKVYENIHSSRHFFYEYLTHYDSEAIGKLTLTNGNIVEIGDSNLLFTPYQGLGF